MQPSADQHEPEIGERTSDAASCDDASGEGLLSYSGESPTSACPGVTTRIWFGLLAIPGEILILGVKLYQITLGPFLGGRCRFEPSCSYYFISAVRKYGAIRGAVKGIWRICRCHPFCEGGYDPP